MFFILFFFALFVGAVAFYARSNDFAERDMRLREGKFELDKAKLLAEIEAVTLAAVARQQTAQGNPQPAEPAVASAAAPVATSAASSPASFTQSTATPGHAPTTADDQDQLQPGDVAVDSVVAPQRELVVSISEECACVVALAPEIDCAFRILKLRGNLRAQFGEEWILDRVTDLSQRDEWELIEETRIAAVSWLSALEQTQAGAVPSVDGIQPGEQDSPRYGRRRNRGRKAA